MTAVKKAVINDDKVMAAFREQMLDMCEPMSFSTFKASYDPATGVKTFKPAKKG
jgi:hypothetical protein